MPPAATKSKYGKISKSQILTPPQGHVMSVRCDQPLDELTVHVWLLYHHPIFSLIIALFIEAGQNNRQTDGQTIQVLDAPGGPFRPWHNNYGMMWKVLSQGIHM